MLARPSPWKPSLGAMLLATATTACASIAGLADYGDRDNEGAGGAPTGQGGTSNASSSNGGASNGGASAGGADGCDYASMVMASGPIARWRFDDGPDDQSFLDDVGGPPLTAVDVIAGESPIIRCDDGSAADFASGEARIDGALATGFVFEGKQSFSVEAWVVPPQSVFMTATENFDVVRKLDNTSDEGWILRLGDSQVKWRRIVGSAESNNVFEDLSPLQTPLHVVATYDGDADVMCAYANGQPLGCSDPNASLHALPPTTADLIVGAGPGGPIDELAIYDRALTFDEITDHYDAGK